MAALSRSISAQFLRLSPRPTRTYAQQRPVATCPAVPPRLRHQPQAVPAVLLWTSAAAASRGYRPSVTAMAKSSDVLESFHDAEGSRFGVAVDGHEAYVCYERDEAARTLDLTHTFTPEALRGQGLASKVVTIAFEYAKENDYRIIPSCSYIPVFVKRNPEWSSLLAK